MAAAGWLDWGPAGGLTAAVDLQFHGDGLGEFRLFFTRELAGYGQHEGELADSGGYAHQCGYRLPAVGIG